MKRLFLCALFLGTVNLVLKAQSKGEEDSAKTEIKQLTILWNKAIINRDSATLVNVMSPDYTVNGSFPLKIWLDNTLHHFATDSLEILGDQKITVYAGIATSEANWYWKASLDGKPRINTEYLVNDVWKKTNGHWQVYIRMSKITKKRF